MEPAPGCLQSAQLCRTHLFRGSLSRFDAGIAEYDRGSTDTHDEPGAVFPVKHLLDSSHASLGSGFILEAKFSTLVLPVAGEMFDTGKADPGVSSGNV